MASPGTSTSCPFEITGSFLNTRAGPPSQSFTTFPPHFTIHSFSPGVSALWSSLRSVTA